MSVTGEPDSPPTRTFAGMADQVSAFLLSFGIMVALYHRERTGAGQMVDGLLRRGSWPRRLSTSRATLSGTYRLTHPRMSRG
jgi:hypothetical protein